MPLRSLSDQKILSRIRRLTERERSLTLAVMLHLNEIERRKLHLKLGYSSMFDYCTSGLGYSASAASRRIRTARCVARFPEVYELLHSNKVSVSTVAQVSRILTPENKADVLARIVGKSQREVEAVVAEFDPLGSVPRDRARTVVVRVKAPVAKPAEALRLAPEKSRPDFLAITVSTEVPTQPAIGNGSHDRNGRDHAACESLEEAVKATFSRRTLLQFAASDEFMAKLEQVRSLLWHQLPADASLEQVLGVALDLVIEKKDPARGRSATTTPARGARNPRRIPASTKRAVYTRDKSQCTFVGTNGRQCASKRALQIDHVKPVALGGAGTPANLRLLCAYHNRLEADRLLGHASRRARPPAG